MMTRGISAGEAVKSVMADGGVGNFFTGIR
jgi:hypothetical protein